MRYDVNKFLFLGQEEIKAPFFKSAQELGIIQFIDKKIAQIPLTSEAQDKLTSAIKILRSLPPSEQEETTQDIDPIVLASDIIALKAKLTALCEEEKKVRQEMIRVQAFGDFSMDELKALEKELRTQIKFYCAKLHYAKTHVLPSHIIFVGSHCDLDYFIAIGKDLKTPSKMIEMDVDRSFTELQSRYSQVQGELHGINARLKALSRYNVLLHKALIEELNHTSLKAAKKLVQCPLDGTSLFATEGWVADNKKNLLKTLSDEFGVYIEEIAISPYDTVPTSLQNKGAHKIGEDLVNIYDTPSSTDKDPSLFVLISFALFFSIIIGDGGYGLILLFAALFIRYKHAHLIGMKRRLLDLATLLSFSCIVWGVLTTSFFGMSLSLDNPLRKVSLISWLVEKKAAFNHLSPITDEIYSKFSDQIMMEMALLIGVIHLILSMLRYIGRNPSNIGWILFMIGAYLYLPSFLEASSMLEFAFGIDSSSAAQNGLYLMYCGLSIAMIIAIWRFKFFGLLELMNLIQIFGDVLSYLRLYALGLSGAMLAATMNELSNSLPFVLGILLLIVGHLINLVLGIMGGVIHGLRLNFLEWYHYSFEGGGKEFKPLHLQELR